MNSNFGRVYFYTGTLLAVIALCLDLYFLSDTSFYSEGLSLFTVLAFPVAIVWMAITYPALGGLFLLSGILLAGSHQRKQLISPPSNPSNSGLYVLRFFDLLYFVSALSIPVALAVGIIANDLYGLLLIAFMPAIALWIILTLTWLPYRFFMRSRSNEPLFWRYAAVISLLIGLLSFVPLLTIYG